MIKINTVFGYYEFLSGISGGHPGVICLINSLVTGVGYPDCDTSVCYFPKKVRLEGLTS